MVENPIHFKRCPALIDTSAEGRSCFPFSPASLFVTLLKKLSAEFGEIIAEVEQSQNSK